MKKYIVVKERINEVINPIKVQKDEKIAYELDFM